MVTATELHGGVNKSTAIAAKSSPKHPEVHNDNIHKGPPYHQLTTTSSTQLMVLLRLLFLEHGQEEEGPEHTAKLSWLYPEASISRAIHTPLLCAWFCCPPSYSTPPERMLTPTRQLP